MARASANGHCTASQYSAMPKQGAAHTNQPKISS